MVLVRVLCLALEKALFIKVGMYVNMYVGLREFVVTTVILTPGVGNPGSVLGGLTPFPGNPRNRVENSRGLQKRYKNNQNWTLGRENV